VITPSLPTRSIASAISLPTSSSAAEIAATCAIDSLPSIGLEISLSCLTATSTAFSIPRRTPTGFAPEATFLRPSRIIACARTVAVVVPSPAISFVLEATSDTSCAPMFSNASSSSISFAIVTPSFVISGEPNFLSNTTLRPFGPSVTLTASASVSTPRSMERRASSENLMSLAMNKNLL
ncbi:conserved hypothetical protein protein, partial [Terribacillus sp. AE2B 122]